MHNLPKDLPSFRAAREVKKLNTYRDKPFINSLVKAVQKVDPGIGAMIFPEIDEIVFYWMHIIIYKVWLDEYNTTKMTIENHVKAVTDTVKLIKSGAINIKPIQRSMEGFNKNKTGKILNR